MRVASELTLKLDLDAGMRLPGRSRFAGAWKTGFIQEVPT